MWLISWVEGHSFMFETVPFDIGVVGTRSRPIDNEMGNIFLSEHYFWHLGLILCGIILILYYGTVLNFSLCCGGLLSFCRFLLCCFKFVVSDCRRMSTLVWQLHISCLRCRIFTLICFDWLCNFLFTIRYLLFRFLSRHFTLRFICLK